MKTNLKRLLALILALSMVMSLLSTSAWAADTSADGSGDPTVSSTEPQEGEPEEAAPEGEAAQPEEAETKPKEEQPKPKMKVKKQSAMSLTTQDVTNYDLWVGGVQVTSANADDVLGDADEGATVSFAPANGDTPATLTLNDADIKTSDYNNSLITCNLHSGGDDQMELEYYPLNIVLSGTNNVSNSNTMRGIYCSGPVTISGSGSLTTHVNGFGIFSGGGIVITSGTIDAQCTYTYGCAILGSTVEISGGTVTATSPNRGINSNSNSPESVKLKFTK